MPISDFEKDSLHILPLAMIPLQSNALSRARLIKNAKLESMLEVFDDASAGSGQIHPDMIEQTFDIATGEEMDDGRKIRALAKLNSFDVYSLRIQIRGLGIVLEDQEHLRLSKAKRAELTKYMLGFTRPLIRQIYGSNKTDIEDISELIALFDNPDPAEALNNLRLITDKLGIKLADLPRFLEDYGDTFLSLAYFQDTHDSLEPEFLSLSAAVNNIRENHQLRQNGYLMNSMTETLDDLGELKGSIEAMFASFTKESENMWDDFSADTFRRVRLLIERNHTTIGAVLCGLSVKLSAWSRRFGNSDHGLLQQSEFIMSDIRQGLKSLLIITREALRNGP
ncbi:MAG: hypothetical protein WD767_01020 [Alphaproteobacteria bacterium]